MNPLLACMCAAILGTPAGPVDPAPPGTLRPGFVELGTVRFSPTRGEVEADGTFNLRAGFLEFLACAPGMKAHETLISLGCDPVDLKTALLLLGIEEGRRPRSDGDLLPLEGDRVVILLRYHLPLEKGGRVLCEKRAEECLVNGPMDRPMARVGWVFTGSTFLEVEPPPLSADAERGTGAGAGDEAEESPGQESPRPSKMVYAPRLAGQYIALCHRPLAILDNPLALPYVDADYYSAPEVLPPVDYDDPPPVTLVFRRPRAGEIDRAVVRMELPPLGEEEPAGDD
ncbi:MAG: YdjY domain-containing protein [Planctomycetota bacterium]